MPQVYGERLVPQSAVVQLWISVNLHTPQLYGQLASCPYDVVFSRGVSQTKINRSIILLVVEFKAI